MAQAPYAQLVAEKHWADRGLYEVLTHKRDRLSEADAAMMLRILDHMHVVDRIFQHHLLGLPHAYQAARSETLPRLPMLAKSVREVDDWYVSYVEGLAASDLEQPVDFLFTSGKRARMTRGEIILHVC